MNDTSQIGGLYKRISSTLLAKRYNSGVAKAAMQQASSLWPFFLKSEATILSK